MPLCEQALEHRRRARGRELPVASGTRRSRSGRCRCCPRRGSSFGTRSRVARRPRPWRAAARAVGLSTALPLSNSRSSVSTRMTRPRSSIVVATFVLSPCCCASTCRARCFRRCEVLEVGGLGGLDLRGGVLRRVDRDRVEARRRRRDRDRVGGRRLALGRRRRARLLTASRCCAPARMFSPPSTSFPLKACLSDTGELGELRGVHGRDRPHDDEQRHEQRDHVGVGEEPALVAALVPAVIALRARGRGRRRASRLALTPTLMPPPEHRGSAAASRRRVLRGLLAALVRARGRCRAARRACAGCRPPGARARPRASSRGSSTSSSDSPLSLLRDRQEDDVRAADAVERRDERAGDRVAERARVRRGSRARARG